MEDQRRLREDWKTRDFRVRVVGLVWFVVGWTIRHIPEIAEARTEPRTIQCFVYFFASLLAIIGFGLVIVGQLGIETVLTPRKPTRPSSID